MTEKMWNRISLKKCRTPEKIQLTVKFSDQVNGLSPTTSIQLEKIKLSSLMSNQTTIHVTSLDLENFDIPKKNKRSSSLKIFRSGVLQSILRSKKYNFQNRKL